MTNVVFHCTTGEPVAFALRQWQACGGEGWRLELSVSPEMEPQGYRVDCRDREIQLRAGDEAGLMYGILDLAKCLELGRPICQTAVSPYLKHRGIKLNIPLDARTPSYSDASDSAGFNIAHMWDMAFWTEFLDRMALNRYNVLSLWTLSPFPSLVRVPEYPLACLEDVKRNLRPYRAQLSGWGIYDAEDMAQSLVTVRRMTIEQKMDFWRKVMEYAKNRCVQVYLFTWNLFVYGTEGNPYGIVCDQNNPVTRDFYYCGTKALMETYPLLAGIGVTTGEHMRQDETDEAFIEDTYARGIRDYLAEHPQRSFRFIHRMQMTKYESIMRHFEHFPCPFEISFKYSQAHMYANTDPAFIRPFLQEKKEDCKIWLTVRNDDFYMFRWGDPDYARAYLRQMPVEVMSGYYMGADGYTWGRDALDRRDSSHPLVVAKMWYMFQIWGMLSYRPDLPTDFFIRELETRFHVDGKQLYQTWQAASRIIPQVNCVHWHDFDFQWYPEGCCMYNSPPTDKLVFADINEFVSCPSAPGSRFDSVAAYCDNVLAAKASEKQSPLESADLIYANAVQALQGVEAIRALAAEEEECDRTLDDIQALGYLGLYYAQKLRAAVALCLYRKTGRKEYQRQAVRLLKPAGALWKRYSAKCAQMYKPQVLTRLCGKVDVQAFDELAEMDQWLAAEG